MWHKQYLSLWMTHLWLWMAQIRQRLSTSPQIPLHKLKLIQTATNVQWQLNSLGDWLPCGSIVFLVTSVGRNLLFCNVPMAFELMHVIFVKIHFTESDVIAITRSINVNRLHPTDIYLPLANEQHHPHLVPKTGLQMPRSTAHKY